MRDDHEERPRRPENGDVGWRRAARLLVFTTVVGGGLFVFLLNEGDHSARGQSAADTAPQTAAEPSTSAEMAAPDEAPVTLQDPSPEPQKTAEMRFWEQVERDRQRAGTTRSPPREPEEVERQTSFNDLNYTPAKQVNIIQSVPVESPRRSSRSATKALSGSKKASVSWVDARGNRTRWKTRFEYHNNRIDNASFCQEQGQGSIPYRECRKGAHEWLKNQCRTQRGMSDEWRRMYCRAYQSYRT